MEKSKVYFTDLNVAFGDNLPKKLKRLILAAGLDGMDLNGKYTAIKMHFGEKGNLAYLRPPYAKVIADSVREKGGKPFLTDCNTLYIGGRKNALDHLETAMENGFSPLSVGCQIIIGDGLKGGDDVAVPVDGEFVKEAKIGRVIMDADAIISLSHFKGHEITGFGGAIKNVGMGCGSLGGKMDMHSTGKPIVRAKKCVGCGVCTKACAHDAIKVSEGKAAIDGDKCVGCGRCMSTCAKLAIVAAYDTSFEIVNKKMAEYTKAVLDGRPHFHVSIVTDVSPQCDCHSDNNLPIVPNVGMFASMDPVALDIACADAVNAQPPVPGSWLDCEHEGCDHFAAVGPGTNWRVCIEHARKIGLGSNEYELIEVK